MNTPKIITIENRNMKIFYSKMEIRKRFMWEKKISFETKGMIVKHSLDIGFNDIKFVYAYGEKKHLLYVT